MVLQVLQNKKRAAIKTVVYDKQKPLDLNENELRKLLYVVIHEDACGKGACSRCAVRR